MIINLSEIPEEGRHYICNRETAELNASLADLIADRKYDVKFFIKPMPGGFEMTGEFKTHVPEQCSRCAEDFELGSEGQFHEILLPELDEPRTAKYSKPNHFSDMASEGTEHVEYKGNHFNMGEYVHEAIALTIPFQPLPPEDKEGNCSLCHKLVKGCTFGYEEVMEEKKENPFSQLKGLKF
ncbi:MAG: DUF177 domain-containing protein [Pseudobdellovibrionaceae bacterium]